MPLTHHRAKYIEGLENRLERMENLLRLSGVLGQDEESTDLAELEKRLEQKNRRMSTQPSSAGTAPSPAMSLSQPPSTANYDADNYSPRSTGAGLSPTTKEHRDKDRDDATTAASNAAYSPNLDGSADDDRNSLDDVVALSDMMCSLVTTQTGETRYLGRFSLWPFPHLPDIQSP